LPIANTARGRSLALIAPNRIAEWWFRGIHAALASKVFCAEPNPLGSFTEGNSIRV
jgi:hypothetical protein